MNANYRLIPRYHPYSDTGDAPQSYPLRAGSESAACALVLRMLTAAARSDDPDDDVAPLSDAHMLCADLVSGARIIATFYPLTGV